ncbi:TRAP transporter small permease [Peptoniphilus equinus]|uniref:TRAP transporter small permease n=1 Tax=Peptoniphilus equinus TaxID=3016343 RepID=A0ABY7QUQ7_9FIRM|nr:TRAP transporter small permease [Peptoniphilus equinus]WBW50171.1 TRAP transporter small permease [Peptoniphilus equinus]
MKKFFKLYDELEEKLLVFSLVFSVVLISFQIIMRYIFNASVSWSEELARYLFIWQTWLGVSIAFHYHEHIKVDLIFTLFKSAGFKKVIDVIIQLIWLGFNLFLAYEGFKLLQSMNARHALSAGMRLPLIYVYASLPVSSVILALRIFLDMIGMNRTASTGQGEKTATYMEKGGEQ